MKTYIYLTAVCLIIGCSGKNTSQDVESFTTERKTLNVSERYDILNPDYVSILDTTLIVYEAGIDSNFLHLLSLTNFNKIARFGRVGNGPGEYSTNLKTPINITGNSKLSIFDWSKKRVFGYSSFADSELKIAENYALPPEFIIGQRAAFLDSNSVVVTGGGIQNGVIGIVNTQTDEIIYVNPYPDLPKNVNIREGRRIFWSEVTINYEKQLIAIAMAMIPEIIIVSFEGEIISRTKIVDYDFKKIVYQEEMERVIQFHDIGSSLDYIYAVRVGQTPVKLGEYLETGEYKADVSTVYVFNWLGVLVKKIRLDGKFHPFITIDPSNNRIFSIDRFTEPILDIVYFESNEIK